MRDPGGHRNGHRASEQGLPGDGLRGARCDRHADSGATGEIAGAAMLLHKIEIIGKLVGKSAEHPRVLGQPMASLSRRLPSSWSEPSLDPLVILGASTGGPQALAEVLPSFPRTLKPASSSSSTLTRHLPPDWGNGWPNKSSAV